MAPLRYSAHHMVLHWGAAALSAVQFALAGGMIAAFAAKQDNVEIGSAWTTAAIAHALIGVTIALLTLWLLALRRTADRPPRAAALRVVRAIAGLTHALFFAVLIALPVAGVVAWATESGTAAGLHRAGGHLLLALIVLHLAVIAWHQIRGDRSVLRRMLPR